MSEPKYPLGSRVKVVELNNPWYGLFYDVTSLLEVSLTEWRYGLDGGDCLWTAEQLELVETSKTYTVDDVIRHCDSPTEYVVTAVDPDGTLAVRNRSSSFVFSISAYAAKEHYRHAYPSETWHERVAHLARAVCDADNALRAAKQALHAAELAHRTAVTAYDDAVLPARIVNATKKS